VSEGARAMFKLAMRFREGRGVKKDACKAVDWLARAAIKGLPKAHLSLGMCYLQGEGVPADDGIGERECVCVREGGGKGGGGGVGAHAFITHRRTHKGAWIWGHTAHTQLTHTHTQVRGK